MSHLHPSTTIIRTCQVFMLSPHLLDLPLCVLGRSFLNKTIFVSCIRANVWLSLPSFYCPNNIRWLTYVNDSPHYVISCLFQWSRGLRRGSSAARSLGLWVGIPPGVWMFVCCECCVLSGRGLCYELITRPEESYRLWCAVVCDLETLRMRGAMSHLGPQRLRKKERVIPFIHHLLYSA
jgi:hypothetical protein